MGEKRISSINSMWSYESMWISWIFDQIIEKKHEMMKEDLRMPCHHRGLIVTALSLLPIGNPVTCGCFTHIDVQDVAFVWKYIEIAIYN